MDTIGGYIRKNRTKAGLEQVDIYNMTGISASAISRFELGKDLPTLKTFRAICRALGVGVPEEMKLFLCYGRKCKPENIGEYIRGKRIDAEVTQIELSEKLDISQPSIHGIEHGRFLPNEKTLEKICEVLKCPLPDEKLFPLWKISGKRIGGVIKRERMKKGLTRKKLGEIVGVYGESIGHIEAGKSRRASTIKKISRELELPLEKLLKLASGDEEFIIRMSDLSGIGEFIKLNRIQKGLTQRGLARIANVSHMTINRLENNVYKPRKETRDKILDALGVSIDD